MDANPEATLKDRLIALNVNRTALFNQLYTEDPAMFTPSMVNLIVSLATKSKYTLRDLAQFQPILELVYVRRYADSENPSEMMEYERLLDTYFATIGSLKNKNPTEVSGRMLNMLKATLTFPSNKTSATSNVHASFRSTYIPKHGGLICNKIDIDNIIESQLRTTVECTPEEELDCVNNPREIKLEGPFLTSVVSAIVGYQDMIVNMNQTFGLKTEPYIRAVNLECLGSTALVPVPDKVKRKD